MITDHGGDQQRENVADEPVDVAVRDHEVGDEAGGQAAEDGDNGHRGRGLPAVHAGDEGAGGGREEDAG